MAHSQPAEKNLCERRYRSGWKAHRKLCCKQAKQKRPVLQPAGTMGSTTEVTVSTPKTYQTAKKNTAFARRVSQRMANKANSKSVPSFNLLVPWEVPRKLPLAPQRLTKQRRKTPNLLAECHKGWQTKPSKSVPSFNLLVPWEVPRKLPLAPQRLTKQRRKTPHLLAACHKGADTTVKFLRFARRLHLTEQPRGRIFNLFPSKPFSILPHSSLCTSV